MGTGAAISSAPRSKAQPSRTGSPCIVDVHKNPGLTPVSKISPIASPSTSSKPAAARRAASASPALLWRCSGQCCRRCIPRYRPGSPLRWPSDQRARCTPHKGPVGPPHARIPPFSPHRLLYKNILGGQARRAAGGRQPPVSASHLRCDPKISPDRTPPAPDAPKGHTSHPQGRCS